MDNNVCKILFDQAMRQPGAIAAVDSQSWLTYQDLANQIGVLAAYLSSNGVRRGHRVISGIRSGLNELVAMLAIASLGAFSIHLNPVWPDWKRRRIAQEETADWLILDEKEDWPEEPHILRMPEKLHSLELEPVTPVEVLVDSPFRAVFVTGGGGKRKLLRLTHEHLLARLRLDPADYRLGDRVGILGLYDYGSMYSALRTLRVGTTIGILSNSNLLAGIDFLGITHLSVETEIARGICEHILVEDGRFPSLQRVELNSSSPEPLLVKLLGERVCPSVTFRLQTVAQGTLTETTHDDLKSNPVSAGRVLEKVRLRIVNERGLPQPNGKAGQIQVRSNSGIILGNHDRKDWDNEWVGTGLYGYVTGTHSIFLLGSRNSVKEVNGDLTSPALVEQVIKLLPEIQDAVVLNVPRDDGSGSRLVAAVATDTPGAIDLREHCQGLLQGPIPEKFIVMQYLPSHSRRRMLAFMSRAGG